MRSPLIAPERGRTARSPIVTRAAAQASRELAGLHDQLEMRALDVCRRLRDARTNDERDTAIALACAVADEAD